MINLISCNIVIENVIAVNKLNLASVIHLFLFQSSRGIIKTVGLVDNPDYNHSKSYIAGHNFNLYFYCHFYIVIILMQFELHISYQSSIFSCAISSCLIHLLLFS